ncbi:hypothetical protein, partial [Methylobacterium mesophilicum]|uniref:hypothetical protein n=1 Tax=Methylobacterium mesophilicum TaxID=39956 RepID=UPI001EE24C2E
LRWARYLGRAKVRLQHVLIPAALNIGRIADWLAGETVASTDDHPSLASSAKRPELLHSPAVSKTRQSQSQRSGSRMAGALSS